MDSDAIWRTPRAKRLARAHADGLLPPLPSPEQRREIALRVLLEICQDPKAMPPNRIGAARTLIAEAEACEPARVAGWSPAPQLPAAEVAQLEAPASEDDWQ